ncbi:MAG: hypothetical protein QOJ99_1672 [Bryobacterales bacterium]|nr:hypothetical protein [Bryobacterales bacterium]
MLARLPIVLLLFSGAMATAQDTADPAVALARILAQRGTISGTELSTIESASDGQRVGPLAGILQRKGLLSDAEVAQLRMPPGVLPQQSTPQQALVQQPSQTSQGASLPQASAPQVSAQGPRPEPVTTQAGLAITLYGTLLFNAFYNTAPANIQDIPLFLGKQGSDPTGGDKNFGATARQTRLGLRLAKNDVLGARLSGDFEFDLFGGKTPLPNGMDMDMFRLRLAYGRLDWGRIAFEAGQDWTIFAPLNPTSLASYAIPEFSASGNPWIRLPQVRAEVTKAIGEHSHLLWQVAALDPNMGDYPTTPFSTSRQPGIGERGRMPSYEARLAWTDRVDDRDFTVGVSGHYGRGKNFGTIGALNIQQPVDSWGVALDYSLPFTRKLNVTGEAFEGRALGIFSVTAGESVGAVGTTGGHGVQSRGGWIQGQYNLNPRWQVNLAYGLEVPNAAQLVTGSRWRNQSYMGNITFKPVSSVTFAWEYRRLLTDYVNQRQANERGDHVDMAIGYVF